MTEDDGSPASHDDGQAEAAPAADDATESAEAQETAGKPDATQLREDQAPDADAVAATQLADKSAPEPSDEEKPKPGSDAEPDNEAPVETPADTEPDHDTAEEPAQQPAPDPLRQPLPNDLDKHTRKTAESIRSFAEHNGGAVGALVEYLGEAGSRITMVAGNGTWGDIVVADPESATRAVAASGASIQEEWNREFSAALQTGRREWAKMGGQRT